MMAAAVLLVGCDVLDVLDPPPPPPPPPLAPPPPPAQLPPPFAELKIGASLEELTAAYPPQGDLTACTLVLVGPSPPAVPDDTASLSCAGASAVAGLSQQEAEAAAASAANLASETGEPAPQLLTGVVRAAAQLRGAARVDALTETDLLAAAEAPGTSARDSIAPLAGVLAEGTVTIARDAAGRRSLAGAIDEDCEGVDPAVVRSLVDGSAGGDTAAASRCSAQLRDRSGSLAAALLASAGGLGAVGLARGMQNGPLSPEDPRSYRWLRQRARIPAPAARVAVLVTSRLTAVESYFSGALQLTIPGEHVWGPAIVWLKDGHVSRVLLDIRQGDLVPQLATILVDTYGEPEDTQGTVTTWRLAGSLTVRLDTGPAASLVLQAE